MSRNRIVRLESSDHHVASVDLSVARELKMVSNIIDRTGTANAIFLPEVTGPILANVIEYARHHVADEKPAVPSCFVWIKVFSRVSKKKTEAMQEWEADFVKNSLSTCTLESLEQAANYLECQSLIDFINSQRALNPTV